MVPASRHWSLEGSAPAALRIDRIERDLAAMWKSATTRTGGTAVSRACSSTLAVLCAAGDAEEASRRVRTISRLHPTRALVLELQPGADPPLEASAGAVCHLRGDGRGLICAEVIQVTADPGAEARLPSVVRSLAVGGLPLALLVTAPGLRSGPAFREISRDADVVIVESGSPADLPGSEDTSVRDLAWSASTDRRRALATAARHPAARTVLTAPRTVRVGRPSGPLTAATVLLAGWIAARLGLEPGATDGPDRVLARTETRTCRIDLAPGGPALRIEGASGEIEMHLDAGDHLARVEVPGSQVRVALRPQSFADRVIQELHQHEPNPAHRAALPLGRRIARALETSNP
ncbi:MAG: glucose-6-phosphate dehydrogenase assembly protein OpcA [Acidobacteriota bacterium]|jgi:glucose-6-phosphate dehydrogenase assembly protein OpcA